MLASEEVDAVCVCVPHDLHLEVARAAVGAGAHLLMEKPITTTLEDADVMIRAVEEAGLTMMIGFVHRFRNEVFEAKRLVHEGAIGTPATALDKFCSSGGPHPPAWVWEGARSGGGVLMYGGIHGVDRILWLLETSVETVYARSHAYTGWSGDVEDGLVAVLSLANGVTATLFENSPPYGRPGGWETELFGSEGAVRIRTGEWCELTSLSRSLTVQTRDERHFHREVAEFVAAIREGREPSVPAAAGRTTLEVVTAIYESARLGAPVEVVSLRSEPPTEVLAKGRRR
jgi:predicted dehydrogenase